MNCRENISEYISNNYTKLQRAARNITKNDSKADDLFHIIVEDLLSREKYTETVYRCNNFYNYIVRAMVVQFYSGNTRFHKENRMYFSRDFSNEISDEIVVEDKRFMIIINLVHGLELFPEELKMKLENQPEKNKKLIKNKYKAKNMLYKNVFFYYFYAEQDINIDGLTLIQVEELRKQSERSVAKHYGISPSSVHLYLTYVKSKIK